MNRKDFIKNIGLAGLGLSFSNRIKSPKQTSTAAFIIGTRVSETIPTLLINRGIKTYFLYDRPLFSLHYYGVPKIMVDNRNIDKSTDLSWFGVESEKLISGAYEATSRSGDSFRMLALENARFIIVGSLGCDSTIGIMRGLIDEVYKDSHFSAAVTLPFLFETSKRNGKADEALKHLQQKCQDVRAFDLSKLAGTMLFAQGTKREKDEMERIVQQLLNDINL